jgi:hypothetical protein
MATNVSGDLLDIGARVPGGVTVGVNIAAKTFVNIDGTLPSSAAACTGGVAASDTPSGEVADVKLPPGVYAVRAMGTVTKGLLVEILQGSVYGNISGTKTAITAAGVQNISAGFAIGRALTTGASGDTVLVNLSINQKAA